MSNKDFEAMREAFEIFAKTKTRGALEDVIMFARDDEGYIAPATQHHFETWQAARAKYEPKWISVDDLSEHIPCQEPLWCLTSTGDRVVACYWPTEDYHDTEVWQDEQGISAWETDEITHWQPLPPAPQEADHG